MDEKLELIKKYSLTVDQLNFSIDEISLEDLETKLKEFNIQSDENQNNAILTFSATYNQKREALRNALDSEIIRDADGNLVEETYFYIVDASDEYVFVEKSHWTANGDYESKYGRFTYSFDETNLTAIITSEFEEMFLMWLTAEQKSEIDSANANYEQMKSEFDEYKSKYSTLNEEYDRLKKFQTNVIAEQRTIGENEIFIQFEKLNGNPDFETLKANAKDFDLETLTDKCFSILGKVSANFALNKPTEKKVVKISIDNNSGGDPAPYGGIIEHYSGKKD